jgi:hypothetical protein
MQRYDDLVQLARICWKEARWAQEPALAARLKRMAKEYQERAAELDGGTLPDIGEPEPSPARGAGAGQAGNELA